MSKYKIGGQPKIAIASGSNGQIAIASGSNGQCYFNVDKNNNIVEPVKIGETLINVSSYEVIGSYDDLTNPFRTRIRLEGFFAEPNNRIGGGSNAIPITKVIFSGPCTIVFWANKEKVVVRRSEGDKNDRRTAIVYAIAKRKFGTNSQIHRATDAYAKSNAQRAAILHYIVAQDGYDVDEILENLAVEY